MKKIIALILLLPNLVFAQTQISGSQTKDGAITNAKVNASAGIAYTKINFTGITPADLGAGFQPAITVVSPIVKIGNELSLTTIPTSLGGTGLVGGLPEGEIVFGSGSAFMSNPLFYWDEATSRLGVNDGTPNSTLSVGGTGSFTSFVTIVNAEASALAALNLSNSSTGSNVIRAYSTSNATVPVLIESENFVNGLQVNNRIVGTSLALANVTTDNGSGFDTLTNRVLFTPGADGVLTLTNAAASGFTQLNFGGTTSSFPALKRSTTNLIVRLGDDSANGGLETETLKITVGTPAIGDVWTATDTDGNGEWTVPLASGWENTSVPGVVQLDTPTEEVLIASTLQIGDYNAAQQNLLHIEQTVSTEPADVDTFVGSKINLTADYPSTSTNFTFIGSETNLTTGSSFDNTAGVSSTLTAISGITRYNAVTGDAIENVQGGSFISLLTGDGTITYGDGLRARAGISGGVGTVINARALVARTPSGATGIITNSYGLYIEDQKTAQVTNPFQIYSTGAAPSILRSTAAAIVPLTLKVPDAQSTNTFLIENETGTDLFAVNSAGVITTGGYQGTAITDTYLASTLNFSSKTVRVPNSTTLPATCTVGDSYMDTDATSGSRWYLCESTDTWAVQGGAGISGLTATKIPVATSGTAVQDSAITHNSTTGVTTFGGSAPYLLLPDITGDATSARIFWDDGNFTFKDGAAGSGLVGLYSNTLYTASSVFSAGGVTVGDTVSLTDDGAGGNALQIKNGSTISWPIGTPDTQIERDAAGQVGVYGAGSTYGTVNTAVFKAYGAFTDGSNYVRGSFSSTSTTIDLVAETAGTGSDDVSVNITAAGTGTINLNSPIRGLQDITASTAGSGAPNVLTSAQSRSGWTNEGSTAENYHTLPTASTGLTYTFCTQDVDGLRVTANTGDTIRLSAAVSASAGYINSVDIGSCVTLTAINATEWFATTVTGTWTVN